MIEHIVYIVLLLLTKFGDLMRDTATRMHVVVTLHVLLHGASYPSGTLNHAIIKPKSVTREAMGPGNIEEIFALARSQVLTYRIVNQEDATG